MTPAEKTYTLDIPQREGKEGYIGTFLTSWLNIQSILKSPEFSQEPIRIYYMMESIISQIPEEEEREKIRISFDKKFAELKEKYLKDNQIEKLTEKQHSHLLIVSALRTIGLTTDYVDKHIGVSTKNKVGFVRKL